MQRKDRMAARRPLRWFVIVYVAGTLAIVVVLGACKGRQVRMAESELEAAGAELLYLGDSDSAKSQLSRWLRQNAGLSLGDYVYLCRLNGRTIDARHVRALCGLEHLNGLELNNSNATVEDLAQLTCLKELGKLELRGTAIDSSAIPVLRGFASLDLLDLRDTDVDGDSADEVRRALPGAVVLSDPTRREN